MSLYVFNQVWNEPRHSIMLAGGQAGVGRWAAGIPQQLYSSIRQLEARRKNYRSR